MLTETDQIRNLIFEYADLVDDGDLDGLAALFAHATINSGSATLWYGRATGRGQHHRPDEIWHGRQGDTPKDTKHLVTNVAIEILEPRQAVARSYFVVLFSGRHTISPVISGRYHDEFDKELEGQWRFRSRRYIVDQVGEVNGFLGLDAAGEDLLRAQALGGRRVRFPVVFR